MKTLEDVRQWLEFQLTQFWINAPFTPLFPSDMVFSKLQAHIGSWVVLGDTPNHRVNIFAGVDILFTPKLAPLSSKIHVIDLFPFPLRWNRHYGNIF